MYEHVKTGCKHIPPSEQPLQFQSGCYLNKPRILRDVMKVLKLFEVQLSWSCVKVYFLTAATNCYRYRYLLLVWPD